MINIDHSPYALYQLYSKRTRTVKRFKISTFIKIFQGRRRPSQFGAEFVQVLSSLCPRHGLRLVGRRGDPPRQGLGAGQVGALSLQGRRLSGALHLGVGQAWRGLVKTLKNGEVWASS